MAEAPPLRVEVDGVVPGKPGRDDAAQGLLEVHRRDVIAHELALLELGHGQPQDVTRFRGPLRQGSGIGSALQRTGGGQHGPQGGLAVGLAGCGLHEVGPVTDAPLLLGG